MELAHTAVDAGEGLWRNDLLGLFSLSKMSCCTFTPPSIGLDCVVFFSSSFYWIGFDWIGLIVLSFHSYSIRFDWIGLIVPSFHSSFYWIGLGVLFFTSHSIDLDWVGFTSSRVILLSAVLLRLLLGFLKF